jgi:hypothetical protein
MLLQTNSYIVPKDKRAEHSRVLRRFRAALAKLGCDSFEVYEQVGANWNTGEPTGRYVQIMRFRDRRHQLAVQQAERGDPVAQAIIAEFCQLINFPYQQQQGLFAVGFYNGVLPVAPTRPQADDGQAAVAAEPEPEAAAEAPPAPEQFEAEEAVAEAAPSEPDQPDEFETEDDKAGTEDSTTLVAGPVEEPAPEASEDDTAAPADETETDQLTPEDHAAPEGHTDDLGALLDAHLDHLHPDNGQHAEHPLDHASDTLDEGQTLDALDLDDLEMRDQRSSDPQRSRNHVAG